jgi:Protein of unknown function (DUF2840)
MHRAQSARGSGRRSARCATVLYVRPGGDIQLRLAGWPMVERVLQMIDVVETLGIDPADAAPDVGALARGICIRVAWRSIS